MHMACSKLIILLTKLRILVWLCFAYKTNPEMFCVWAGRVVAWRDQRPLVFRSAVLVKTLTAVHWSGTSASCVIPV